VVDKRLADGLDLTLDNLKRWYCPHNRSMFEMQMLNAKLELKVEAIQKKSNDTIMVHVLTI